MTDQRILDHAALRAAAGSALLLVQFAAARAEIGAFARRGRETPHRAACVYQATARLQAGGAGHHS